MAKDDDFRAYVLDQLSDFGTFESKNMFGGTALLQDGKALAKIKHGTLWLKTDARNVQDYVDAGMPQYSYGKDNSRHLNFHEVPAEVLEDREVLARWARKAQEASQS